MRHIENLARCLVPPCTLVQMGPKSGLGGEREREYSVNTVNGRWPCPTILSFIHEKIKVSIEVLNLKALIECFLSCCELTIECSTGSHNAVTANDQMPSGLEVLWNIVEYCGWWQLFWLHKR